MSGYDEIQKEGQRLYNEKAKRIIDGAITLEKEDRDNTATELEFFYVSVMNEAGHTDWRITAVISREELIFKCAVSGETILCLEPLSSEYASKFMESFGGKWIFEAKDQDTQE